ncbi:kin of IRRE-like protein 3 isoform X2 [Tachypleus tridentatus]|uniref:kin of IRRE-like protein 3 isoform X2 n=1 Tax=Tachypleus tridentatus TaxID=6853 RepID=UPI003FD3F874
MFVSFLVVTTLLKAVLSLKLLDLYIPSVVRLASPVWLYCGYDLEGDDLYSVKWYKNHVEFYRYLPSDNPPGQKYDLVGVHVDLKCSNQTHVYLNQTDLNTDGLYGCEVSTEAPSYRTVQAEKKMKIYVLPKEKPAIMGLESMYKIGDEVNVTCVSNPSKPAAQLTWLLNGRPADPTFLTTYRPQRHLEGLESTVLGLKFIVTYNHLKRGVISLRCTATVSQEYYSKSSEIVIGGRIKTDTTDYIQEETRPKLTTGKKEYRVGDVVEVNCSSSRDKETVRLTWFVNDQEVKVWLKANHLYVIDYSPIIYKDDAVSSLIGLKFRLTHDHLLSEGLRIKCTATKSTILDTRNHNIIVGGVQRSSGFHVLASSGKESSTRSFWNLVFCSLLFHLMFLRLAETNRH